MPTFIYRTRDNARVPSVTTINKIGQDSGGLIHWAWQLGLDGKDYRQVRDDAAEGGTVGHALVEAAIRNSEIDLSSYGDEARAAGAKAFAAYSEWRNQTKIEMIESEVPLVSESYKFGGCIDAICRGANGQLCITDFKTGGIYADHLCQVAAYAQLWNENRPLEKVEGGFHLCRFNRETGDFAHHYFGNLSDAWVAFLKKRELYDLLAGLKKRV